MKYSLLSWRLLAYKEEGDHGNPVASLLMVMVSGAMATNREWKVNAVFTAPVTYIYIFFFYLFLWLNKERPLVNGQKWGIKMIDD